MFAIGRREIMCSISFWEPSADDDIEGVQLGGFGAVQLERLEPESGGIIK